MFPFLEFSFYAPPSSPLPPVSQVSVYRPLAATTRAGVWRLAVRNCLVSEWIWIRVNAMCYFGEKIPSWLSIDFLPSFLVSIKTTELECSLCINGMACMLPVLGQWKNVAIQTLCCSFILRQQPHMASYDQ